VVARVQHNRVFVSSLRGSGVSYKFLRRQWPCLDPLAQVKVRVSFYSRTRPKLALAEDVFGCKG